MYLKAIGAQNFMGATFTIQLAQANAITGDNWAGKSRITNAARLALLGYLPELGKENRATFGLATGPFMVVWAELSDGRRVTRRWSLSGDSVRQEKDIPDGMGDGETIAIMLNAEEYFGLPDRDRVDYVFAHVGLPDAKVADMEARIVSAAPGWQASKMTSLDMDPRKWIDAEIDRATDNWKRCKDWAKRMEETVRGISGLAAAEEPAPRPPRAELLDQRAQVERATTELNQRKGAKIGTYTAQRSALVRRNAINAELQRGTKDLEQKATLQQKVELIEAELRTVVAPSLEEMDALQNKTNGKRADLAAQDAEIAQCGRIVTEALTELHTIDDLNECPYCGATGDGWKKVRAAEMAKKEETFNAKRAQHVAIADALRADIAALEKERVAGQAKFAQWRNLSQQLAQTKEVLVGVTARTAKLDALRAELQALPAEDPALAKEVEDIQTELNCKAEEARTLERLLDEDAGKSRESGRLAEAEAERDKATAEKERWAKAGETLRTLQAELVEAAFKPLLETANAIFPGILRAPLAYNQGEIGFRLGGTWVGHGTFSGTEKALAYGAIQAALASKSPVRLLVLDEMGRLTMKNAAQLAGAALKAIRAGLLEQVIVIDPERPAIYQTASNFEEGRGITFNVIEVRA